METSLTNTVYGTGRRKAAVARVWVEPGDGEVTINGRTPEEYFCRPAVVSGVRQPLERVRQLGRVTVRATVRGGGITGQAGAVRLGVSRALASVGQEFRSALKEAGMLTRDARVVERKKYGLHKARKRHQYSKR